MTLACPSDIILEVHGQNKRKPKRVRTAFTPRQLQVLEHTFANTHYPDVLLREQLATFTSIAEAKIQVWMPTNGLFPWAVGVTVIVYFNKIISLPAPLLYYVFDRSVLLHKIPNICRFYPYFSMLFRFSIAICQLFVLLTVRPLNQNTTDAQRKPKKEWVGNHFQVVACMQLVRSLGRANFHIWKLASPNDSNYANLKFKYSFRAFHWDKPSSRMSLDF